MPRGSLPGERRGGRQKGTPNRATAAKAIAVAGGDRCQGREEDKPRDGPMDNP
jgi:hypothetical protein